MQDIFYNHPYIPTLKEFITLAPDFDRESTVVCTKVDSSSRF